MATCCRNSDPRSAEQCWGADYVRCLANCRSAFHIQLETDALSSCVIRGRRIRSAPAVRSLLWMTPDSTPATTGKGPLARDAAIVRAAAHAINSEGDFDALVEMAGAARCVLIGE